MTPKTEDEAYWYNKFSKVLEELKDVQSQNDFKDGISYLSKWEKGSKAKLDYLDFKIDEDDVKEAGDIDLE